MFAGIGGFRTGLTNAGDFFMPVGWCEKDKHAQKAYRLLYGTEGEYFCDDARNINPTDLPDFDLICGGFPCQPFSVAGQRLGFADERGTLFHEICRLAEARHPKYLPISCLRFEYVLSRTGYILPDSLLSRYPTMYTRFRSWGTPKFALLTTHHSREYPSCSSAVRIARKVCPPS